MHYRSPIVLQASACLSGYPYSSRIPDDDNECLLALFGSAKKGAVRTSRVQFSDMFLSNLDELKRGGEV